VVSGIPIFLGARLSLLAGRSLAGIQALVLMDVSLTISEEVTLFGVSDRPADRGQ